MFQHALAAKALLDKRRVESNGCPMKNSLLVLSLLLCTSLISFAGGKAGWEEDYEKSLARAKAESKLLLMDFTGSDWCGWCIKLDKEVFSEKAFQDYAKEKLVLLELDFPQQKEQSQKLKDQNEKLSKEYGIEGYPTIVVLNSEGKKIGELGYVKGGPTAFIAELDKLKAK